MDLPRLDLKSIQLTPGAVDHDGRPSLNVSPTYGQLELISAQVRAGGIHINHISDTETPLPEIRKPEIRIRTLCKPETRSLPPAYLQPARTHLRAGSTLNPAP